MTDARSTDPNITGRRKARFIHGWRDASAGTPYTEETLSRLTWQNLGWRLGSAGVGETSDKLLGELYDWCVRQQAEAGSRVLDE